MSNILETLSQLVSAGFTKDDISALMQMSQPQKQEQKQPEAKAVEKEEAPAEPKVKEKSEVEKLFESLGMKIDSLTGAIQKSNISNMGMGTVKEESVDDILAKIINHNGQEVE